MMRNIGKSVVLVFLWIAAAVCLTACTDYLSYGDPDNVPSPPAGAIGFPSRATDLDVKPGFQNPPPGYGEVGFYWWLGDPLTRERIQWHIEQISGKGVMGLQINYAHSDKGGRFYGVPYKSDPPLFSEDWWKLTEWFMHEAKKHNMWNFF